MPGPGEYCRVSISGATSKMARAASFSMGQRPRAQLDNGVPGPGAFSPPLPPRPSSAAYSFHGVEDRSASRRAAEVPGPGEVEAIFLDAVREGRGQKSAQGDTAFNRCKYTACSVRHRHALPKHCRCLLSRACGAADTPGLTGRRHAPTAGPRLPAARGRVCQPHLLLTAPAGRRPAARHQLLAGARPPGHGARLARHLCRHRRAGQVGGQEQGRGAIQKFSRRCCCNGMD